jgi:hypothetical protein
MDDATDRCIARVKDKWSAEILKRAKVFLQEMNMTLITFLHHVSLLNNKGVPLTNIPVKPADY